MSENPRVSACHAVVRGDKKDWRNILSASVSRFKSFWTGGAENVPPIVQSRAVVQLATPASRVQLHSKENLNKACSINGLRHYPVQNQRIFQKTRN